MSSLIHSEPQSSNLARDSTILLRARLLTLELMVDLLWADRMSRVPNPVDETLAFKREVLGSVAVPDPDLREEVRRLYDIAVGFIDERLNSIVNRLAFDESLGQKTVKRAAG